MDTQEKNIPSTEKLEQEIERLEHILHEYYCDAGKTILETAEAEGRKINCLVDRIVEMRKGLVNARGDKECTRCGTFSGSESLYCSHCGSSLDEIREENN